MKSLIKNILSGVVVGSMILMTSACTIRISEDTFIASDQQAVAFTNEFTEQLQQAMPNHSITAVNLNTSDQVRLNGFYIDNPHSETTLIFFQGNGMKVEPHSLAALTTLSTLNTDIFVMDRRGLGASEGQPSIRNIQVDAKQQLDYLYQQYQPQKVILHGYSLGSFIAADLAKDNKVDALVLHGSATNADDWVDEKTPWYLLFTSIEMPEDFRRVDNEQVVAQYYKGPLLVIGAENDDEVPASLSEKLYAASQSEVKELIMVPNVGHQGMLDNANAMSRYQAFVQAL
ncbi:alpha/beta hydrolase [Shewanella donghaensis]|uniref:alpha/beta hydrolase n=1 Tax=Shewanella donghaensis TaxID=238836 RepID=UPI001182AA5E|nr:alpha/beta fold hydrolase [Shewanella donghaensis]